MALYSTSSSTNNTSTINDSLTTNHHIQPDKRSSLMDSDNAIPTKRKRLSMAITEPTVTMNSVLSSSCPLATSTNKSGTLSIMEQTSPTKSQKISFVTGTPIQSEAFSLSTMLCNASQHSSTKATTETSQQIFTQQQQQQNTAISVTPPTPSVLDQRPPILQQPDTLETAQGPETSQPLSTYQQSTVTSLLPSAPVSDQPILWEQDTTEVTKAMEEARLSSSTPQQEPSVSLPPPSSSPISDQSAAVPQPEDKLEATKVSQQNSTQQQQESLLVSLPPSSPPVSDQPISQQQNTSETTEAMDATQLSPTQQQGASVSRSPYLAAISNQVLPALKSSDTPRTTGKSQPSSVQQQTFSLTLPSPSSPISNQAPPTLQKLHAPGTTETSQVSPIQQQQQQQQQQNKSLDLSPLTSSPISDQAPSTSQQLDTPGMAVASQLSSTQQQQQESSDSLPPASSISSKPSPVVVPEETVPSVKATSIGAHHALPTTASVQEPTVSEGRSKRKRKPVEYNVNEWETFKQVGRGRRSARDMPRWYTQSYMIFLALREHPDHCLSRPALIHAALAMDEKISKERNLPRVFRSKTPSNSASAVLTTNIDRLYISYKPEGSRSRWFRLAYPPGNFDHAYGEYRKWMEKLVNHDWLYCFGVPLENSVPMTMEDIAAIKVGSSTALPLTTTDAQPSSLTNSDSNNNNTSLGLKDDENNNDRSTEENGQTAVETMDNTIPSDPLSSSSSTPTVTKLNEVQKHHQPMYQLDQLDLNNVPKKWQDIVRVDTSTIPNSGQGLFAVRELPYNTPLGFYFGVPMTEYEFDSIKENVGRASEYSIKYRKTILDATDDQGEPYTLKNIDDGTSSNNDNDEPAQRLCPFHYMNEAKDINMANILFVEGVVVNQVICWSKRPIMPGEELLVWYGTDVNRYWKDDADLQQTSS